MSCIKFSETKLSFLWPLKYETKGDIWTSVVETLGSIPSLYHHFVSNPLQGVLQSVLRIPLDQVAKVESLTHDERDNKSKSEHWV